MRVRIHTIVGAARAAVAGVAPGIGVAALLATLSGAHAQTPVQRPERTIWSDNLAASPLFGYAVASDGEWVAVAAPSDDAGTVANAGSITLFRRDNGRLEFVAKRFPNPLQSALATYSVDIRDGILAVSSSRADPAGPPTLKGQCAIYDLEDPAIPQIGSIRADPRVLGVGNSAIGAQVVVLDRDHVATNNPGFITDPMPSGFLTPGAVFVYERTPSGWQPKQHIRPGADFWGFPPSQAAQLNANARGIDFDGERLVVGALMSFSVYDWGPDQRLHPNSAGEGHFPNIYSPFGQSVAIQGDLVAVGSWGSSAPGLARVQVYRQGSSGWQREAELFPSDGFQLNNGTGYWSNSAFGTGLDIDERERMLIGAPYGQRTNTSSPPPDELPGTVYLFEQGPNGWEEKIRFWDAYDDHGSDFGQSVAFVGDLVIGGSEWAEALGSIRQVGNVNTFLVPIGESECAGEANSTGEIGAIDVVGDREVAYNHLEVRAHALPQGVTSMLLASRQSAFVAHPGASSGNLCLGGSIARFVGSIGTADAAGEIDFAVTDLIVPSPGGPETIDAGDTWTFQVWYRDANPTPTSNFTEARSVVFE